MLAVKNEMDALIQAIRAQVQKELLEQLERGFELEKIKAEAAEMDGPYLDGFDDGLVLVQKLLG